MVSPIITPDALNDDPVHQWNDLWWFWDETWTRAHGPYQTEDDARRALTEYAKYLESGFEYR